MRGFIIGVAATAVGFVILIYLLPEVKFGGDTIQLILLALVFGVINGLIKPIVKLFSLPITVMTLGLFSLVINGGLLLLTAWVADALFDIKFTIAGFPADRISIEAIVWAIVASIVLSLISSVIGLVIHD